MRQPSHNLGAADRFTTIKVSRFDRAALDKHTLTNTERAEAIYTALQFALHEYHEAEAKPDIDSQVLLIRRLTAQRLLGRWLDTARR